MECRNQDTQARKRVHVLDARGLIRVAFLSLSFVMLVVVVPITTLRVRPRMSVNRPTVLDIADGVPLAPLMKTWRDCSQGIYLDVGTNVAVQIRKLYEPEKFPGAKVLPMFDKYFGQAEDRSRVCAVGFEPNSAHTAYLDTVNAHFSQKALPAHVFTGVAVSSRRGQATFARDPGSAKDKHEWSASLATWNQPSITVQLVDLQNFILDVVVPVVRYEHEKTGRLPPVVMKMDIEGAEYTLFPAMVVSGALCRIDLIFAEWHRDSMRRVIPGSVNLTKDEMIHAFESMRITHPSCKIVYTELDDESYVDGTSIPL
jgi:FkbM family methyltransferase